MKHGAPVLQVDGSALRIAIVAASWHTTVMDGLIAGARRGLADAGVTSAGKVPGPGSCEGRVASAWLPPIKSRQCSEPP